MKGWRAIFGDKFSYKIAKLFGNFCATLSKRCCFGYFWDKVFFVKIGQLLIQDQVTLEACQKPCSGEFANWVTSYATISVIVAAPIPSTWCSVTELLYTQSLFWSTYKLLQTTSGRRCWSCQTFPEDNVGIDVPVPKLYLEWLMPQSFQWNLL